MSKKQFTVPIGALLTIGFVGVTVAGIGLVLFLGLSTAFHNTRDLLAENVEGGVTHMVATIDDRLRPVEAQARWIAERVADGRLPVRHGDDRQLAFFFDAAMAATPQVAGVALVRDNGVIRQWHRGGPALPPEDWSDRRTVLDWLARGSANPASRWGPPFWFEPLDGAIVTYETALFDAEGFLGYLTIGVSISDLSLQLVKVMDNAFVLAGRDNVLAHPYMINWRPLEGEEAPSPDAIYAGRSALAPIAELGDPVLERIWTAEYQDMVMLRTMVDTHAVAAEIGDRQYVYIYRQIDRYGPVPWYVGAYLDARQEGEVVRRLPWAIGIGLAVLVAAAAASIFLSRALGRPIRAFVRAFEAVQSERFDDVPALRGSWISEFSLATGAFEKMVAGLAERDLVRRTLGRYVPEQVADILMAEDGGIEPEEAEATILFSDIAGFTSLTEALGPSRIVEVLNAYFSRMTEIIEAHGGVITQFQGDAILAIFNVPLPLADHAGRACRAAMEMRAAVHSETFAGERLSNRIGINTGPVVAGAVGAEGRLTYTVHGDAVNRAARLEALNKEMKTTILVSGTSADRVDDMALVDLGEVEVRGQQGGVRLFTIDD